MLRFLYSLLFAVFVLGMGAGASNAQDARSFPEYVQALHQEMVPALQGRASVDVLTSRGLTPQTARSIADAYVDLFGEDRAGHPDSVAKLFLTRSAKAFEAIRRCVETHPSEVVLSNYEEDATGQLSFCRILLQIKAGNETQTYEVGTVRIADKLHIIHFAATT